MATTQRLRLPAGFASITACGIQYAATDGVIEVPLEHAAAVMAHDPRIEPYVEKEDSRQIDDAARGAIRRLGDHVVRNLEDIRAQLDGVDRKQLFADLKGLGVIVPQTNSTERLREILATELQKKEAEEAAKANAENQSGADAVKAAAVASNENPEQPPKKPLFDAFTGERLPETDANKGSGGIAV